MIVLAGQDRLGDFNGFTFRMIVFNEKLQFDPVSELDLDSRSIYVSARTILSRAKGSETRLTLSLTFQMTVYFPQLTSSLQSVFAIHSLPLQRSVQSSIPFNISILGLMGC